MDNKIKYQKSVLKPALPTYNMGRNKMAVTKSEKLLK